MARGFLQKYGVDFSDIYAPVAKLTTVRAILALINENSLCAHQMDVKTVFLNGYLKDEIYMVLPDGFKNNKDTKMVCKLNKSLYGLKQASKCWNERFHTYITKLGSDNDYCLYSQSETDEVLSYLILYVNDILIISKHLHKVNKIKDNLMKEFEMTDGGEIEFLSWHSHRKKS